MNETLHTLYLVFGGFVLGLLTASVYAAVDRHDTRSRGIQVTRTVRLVLEHLLTAGDERTAWGLSICRATGLGPAKVYPILDRLEQNGWITGERADDGRRYYRLTEAGSSRARTIVHPAGADQ